MARKLFPLTLMMIGVVFVAAGGYTAFRGLDAKQQVRGELLAQRIETTEDASIPSTRVDDVGTARSMADAIDHHLREVTGGLTYAEMGRYMTDDGAPIGTDDPAAAVKGANGRPLNNPLRAVAFEATTLRSSLYTSVMAFEMGNLVLGLGLVIVVVGFAVGGIGMVLRALLVPTLARRQVPALPGTSALTPTPVQI
ncbi:MAG TPA: hypothetical protein VM942_02595 [Acidimicrobiales bacterium]|nr:hypothetical protein [Acidimicrobiales bacterium]